MISRDEFLDQYGDVEVSFKHYYNNTFEFEGIGHGGETITVQCGRTEDAMRYMDINDQPERIENLEYIYAGEVWHNSNKIYGFFELEI